MKYLIIVLWLCLLVTPAQASDKPLLMGLLAANAADLVSTRVGLAQGGMESNPFMQSGFGTQVTMKTFGTVTEMAVIHTLWQQHHKKLATVLTIGVMSLNGIVAVHNLSAVRK